MSEPLNPAELADRASRVGFWVSSHWDESEKQDLLVLNKLLVSHRDSEREAVFQVGVNLLLGVPRLGRRRGGRLSKRVAERNEGKAVHRVAWITLWGVEQEFLDGIRMLGGLSKQKVRKWEEINALFDQKVVEEVDNAPEIHAIRTDLTEARELATRLEKKLGDRREELLIERQKYRVPFLDLASGQEL
jgi:hypothetical protein